MVKHSQSSQNIKFAMSLQYLKQEVRDKLIFCMQIKIKVDFNTLDNKVFYKVIPSLLMGMIKNSQSTQRKKIAISLQCLKKEVRDRLYFWHADKRQSCYKLAL